MNLWRISISGLALLLLTACVNTDKEFSDDLQHFRPVEPPTFLNSDVASLFGNATFTAHLEVHKGIPGTRPPTVGELSARNGSLFYLADERRNQYGIAGGVSVLWEANAKTAYLLNEPLQGYAPIRSAATNSPGQATLAGEEDVNGERCRKTIITQTVGTDAIPTLIVWRSIALQDLPVRIQSTNNTQSFVMDLSRVRFQSPPTDLFVLPNGFKAYESTEAMIGELLRRRTEAMDGRSRIRRDKYGTSTAEDPGQTRPTRPY